MNLNAPERKRKEAKKLQHTEVKLDGRDFMSTSKYGINAIFFSCTIDLSWVFNDDGSRAWYALHESRSSTSYLEFHAKRIIQARFQAVLRITSSMFFFYGWQICDKQSPMDHFNVHETVQLTQVNHEGDIKCDGHENCVYDSTFHHE